MALEKYLEVNGITLGQFAKQCGTSASTILRVKDAAVAPSKRVARAIWEATGGEVTPNDIFGLHHAHSKCECKSNEQGQVAQNE